MLRIRAITALVLMPIVLGSVYFGGLAFFLLVALALLVAGWEFFEMAQHAGHRPQSAIGLALIALILIDAYAGTNALREIIVGFAIVTLIVGVFRPQPGWLVGWAMTLAGALYVGWIGSYFLLVRGLPNGLVWTVIALVIAWATDIGGYVVGTRIGKRGFFTQVSPKKTWEGAFGGLGLALAVMLVIGAFIDLPLIHRVLFGAGLCIAASFGDLAESLLKRQSGVKDSSHIIPGHGGLLDRIDSLLFAAVFAYYYLVWVLRV